MALFNRNASAEPPEPRLQYMRPLLDPVVVSAADLPSASWMMDTLEMAIRQKSSDLTYNFGIALNRAGGFPDLSALSKYQEAAALMELGELGSEQSRHALQRPWRWLAAVAHEALVARDALLASRIAGCTWLWSVEFAPKMNNAAFFEGVVAAPSAPSRAAVYSSGIRAADSPGVDEAVTGYARLCASEVLGELRDLVEPDVLSGAQRIAA